jgi:hypothetical protein
MWGGARGFLYGNKESYEAELIAAIKALELS